MLLQVRILRLASSFSGMILFFVKYSEPRASTITRSLFPFVSFFRKPVLSKRYICILVKYVTAIF